MYPERPSAYRCYAVGRCHQTDSNCATPELKIAQHDPAFDSAAPPAILRPGYDVAALIIPDYHGLVSAVLSMRCYRNTVHSGKWAGFDKRRDKPAELVLSA